MDESAITVYSDSVREAIEAIPAHINEMSEEKLLKELNPTVRLYEIKRAFWEEVTRVHGTKKKMIVARVYNNKMSKESFYRLIKNPYAMAWIVNPLTTYEDRTQAALDKVTERYDELISMEITSTKKVKNEEGEFEWITDVDPKKALVLLQVIRNLEDRIKGTAIQRQVSVHTDRPTDSAGAGAGTINMEAVDERLKELEHKLGGSVDGLGERDNLASGHKVSSDAEGGGADDNSSGSKQEDDDGVRRDSVDQKTIEVERGDYRQV